MKRIIPIGCVMLLTACVSGGSASNPEIPGTNAHGGPHTVTQGGAFACENGFAVQVRYLGNDQLELTMDGKQTVMNAAVSGSGERFVSNSGLFGTGAEWHQKGSEAFFTFADPYGNRVETTCRSGR